MLLGWGSPTELADPPAAITLISIPVSVDVAVGAAVAGNICDRSVGPQASPKRTDKPIKQSRLIFNLNRLQLFWPSLIILPAFTYPIFQTKEIIDILNTDSPLR